MQQAVFGIVGARIDDGRRSLSNHPGVGPIEGVDTWVRRQDPHDAQHQMI